MHGKSSSVSTLTSTHVLSHTGWLAGEDPVFRRRLLALARWRSFGPGEELYAIGDAPNALYGLEKGRLDLAIGLPDDEMVTIHRAQPGFWIGDSALLAEAPRGISVTTHGECLLLRTPASALQKLVRDHPEHYAAFYRLSHRNTMLAVKVLAESIALPTRARFAQLLLRLASEDGTVNATQSELGAMAGMSRAAFRRAFSGLIKDGVVKPEYGSVRILDPDALQRQLTEH